VDEQKSIEVTHEMIAAGVKALYQTIPMDIAIPKLCDEEIVETIYKAMAAAAQHDVF
jgi:hypothetical protein